MVYDVTSLTDVYIRVRELEEQVDNLEREFRAKLTRLENEINEGKQLWNTQFITHVQTTLIVT